MVRRVMFVAVLAFETLAHAKTVYIGSPRNPLPDAIERTALRTLMEDAVMGMGHVVADSTAGADVVLKPDIVPVGSAYIFRMETTVGTNPTATSKLRLKTIDELDIAVKRLVEAALQQRDVASAKLGEIVEDEANPRELRRKNRDGGFGAVGLAFLSNLGSEGPSYHVAMGHGWSMGHHLSVAMGFDFTIDVNRNRDTALLMSFRGDAFYHFLDTDVSPFLGANLSYGFARHATTKVTSAGFGAGLTAGMALMRTWEKNFLIGVHGNILFDTSHTSNPMLVALWLGVQF